MIGGWLGANWGLVMGIASGVVSEALAVFQALKYPTNQGVGGVLAGILKFLNLVGGNSNQS